MASETSSILHTRDGLALTGSGYECHALDLRGHGTSEGVRGHVARFEEYLDDIDVFLEHIDRAAANPLPRFLTSELFR